MTTANKNTVNSTLRMISIGLPILGILTLIFGLGWAIQHARFDRGPMIVTGVGAVLLFLSFLKLELANLKYYLHVVIYSVMVIGIGVILYMFVKNTVTRKVDLTENKMFSLSEESSKYLARLNGRVQITVMAPSNDPFREVMDLYNNETNKIDWVALDPKKAPVEARKFGDSVREGDIYVTRMKAVEKGKGELQYDSSKKLNIGELSPQNFENVLTNAIVEVTREQKPKIYFMTGHGEVAFEATAPPPQRQQRAPQAEEPSLSAFREFLSTRAMATAELDLSKTNVVPKDATLVVLAGPQRDLFPAEAAALNNYLKSGGKLMALMGVPASNLAPAPMTNLTTLLQDFGVTIEDNIVIDLAAAQLGVEPTNPVMSIVEDHAITDKLPKIPSLLPPSRSLQLGDAQGGLKAVPLIESSKSAFSVNIAEVMAQARISPPPRNQWKAQVIGAAVGMAPPQQQMPGMPPPPTPKGGTRLVVFGNSDLIQNSFLPQSQTVIRLMLNTVNWLMEQEDLISVPPREVKGTPIVLDMQQLRLIFVFAVVVIPAVLFFGGVSYSMMRRRA